MLGGGLVMALNIPRRTGKLFRTEWQECRMRQTLHDNKDPPPSSPAVYRTPHSYDEFLCYNILWERICILLYWRISILSCGDVFVSCHGLFIPYRTVLVACGTVLVSCGTGFVSCGTVLSPCGTVLLSCRTVLAPYGTELVSCGTELVSCGTILVSCGTY